MNKPKATMSDVAAAAGVSKMAVSLALRNHPDISSETRERIRRTAEELGYKPNPLVAALMTELRSKKPPLSAPTIAYITDHERGRDWRKNPTYRKFHKGAEERAAMLGYRLEEFSLGEKDMHVARLTGILWNRNVRGVLIAPTKDPKETLELDWTKFAAVALGFSVMDLHIHRVANHHIHTMKLVLDELYACGYRKIGIYLQRCQNVRVDYGWLAGFDIFRRQHPGCRKAPELIVNEQSEEVFAGWFNKHRPDAIVTLDVPVVKWLKNLGCRVPEDVGVGHLSLHPEEFDFSGAVQNCEVIGATAVDVVAEEMNHNHLGVPSYPKVVYIESLWRPGSTTRQR